MRTSEFWLATDVPCGQPLNETQPLLEILVRGFYPTPYAASPSVGLMTPWYLDYGHLTYWFFIGSTVVIVLWLVYIFSSLSRNIEERRPVRETRGFSRAQTGDILTAVLPLTWSVTMLGHASTHSINFDENTTATTFSFTVIAYQWGWNYFFPREVVELLTAAPRLTGRGRTIGGHAQDRYTALLARARGDYLTQLSLGELLTARHGRHVVSSTLALLIPTLVADTADTPTWVTAGAASALLSQLGAGDARLLAGTAGAATLDRSSHARVLWQRQTTTRHPSYARAQCAGLLGVTGDGSYAKPNASSVSALLPGTLYQQGSDLATQSLRPLSTTVWVGNRLQLIHRHLATAEALFTPSRRVTQTAALVRRQASYAPNGFFTAYPTGLNPLSPVSVQNILLTPGVEAQPLATAWAASTVLDLEPRLRLSAGASQVLSTAQPLQHRGGVLLAVPGVLRGQSATLRGLAGLESGLAQPGTVLNLASWALRQRQGDSVAVLGGDARVLGLSDTPTNVSAAATEFNNLETTFWAGSSFPFSLSSAAATRQVWRLGGALGVSPWAAQAKALSPAGILATPTQSLSCPSTRLGLHPTLSVAPASEFSSVTCDSQSPSAGQPTPGIFATVNALVTPRLGLGRGIGGAFYLDGATPVSQSTSLEATSDTLPTRAAAADTGDLVQLNAKAPSIQGLGQTPYASSHLGVWTQLWSWQVAGAGFPWDRAHRAQFNRRPHTGLGQAEAAQRCLQQGAVLALQRHRFDKAATTLFQPKLCWTQRSLWYPELASAVLDGERHTLLPTSVAVLPAPYLDLDPAFLLKRWAAEINTSRRSDHDARFKVLWGPLAVGAARAGASAPTAWAHTAGPRTLDGLGSEARRQLTWLYEVDGAHNLSAPYAAQLQLRPAVFTPGTGSRALTTAYAPGLGDTQNTAKRAWQQLGGGLRLATKDALLPSSGPSSVWSGSVWSWHCSPQGRPSSAYTVGRVSQAGGYANLRLLAALTLFQEQLGHQQAGGTRSQSTAPQLGHIRLLQDLVWAATAGRASKAQSTLPTLVASAQSRGGYEVMQTDIASMRRLRVTKGIYLPADTPMHGIFGSKDVIHSWAIPGLGVKIDCIPGYSSHRRLVLRWRGLFWGQCMEVCGRYHHWMPILVRVTHRDVFTLWCLTHLRALATRALTGARTASTDTLQVTWAAAAQAAPYRQ